MPANDTRSAPLSARAVIARVRERQPLVHCITAAVSMGLVADGLLASGARPLMTETLAEAPYLTTEADALVINLGTLSTDAAAAIPATVEAATAAAMPWVLDPTAIGTAPVRTPLARRLLAFSPAIICANASEARALAGEAHRGRGADSTAQPTEARSAAELLAAGTGGAVTVTGAVDLILDADRSGEVAFGDELMSRVTGTGCLHTAIAAACAAVEDDPYVAAHAAATWLGVAGQRAGKVTRRPGTFRIALLDAIDEVKDEA